MKDYCNKASLCALAFLLCFCACNSRQHIGHAYTVDPSIKSRVRKKAMASAGASLGAIEFKMYENDSLVVTTEGMPKIPESLILPDLKGDTVSITGYFGMTAGLGYQVVLFKDTCIVASFSKTDVAIYKLQLSDSASFGISIPCKKYELTLSEKPTFKKGQVIDGIISLTSEDFYEVNKDTTRLRVELTGYFTTGPLISMEERYNSLLKQ